MFAQRDKRFLHKRLVNKIGEQKAYTAFEIHLVTILNLIFFHCLNKTKVIVQAMRKRDNDISTQRKFYEFIKSRLVR